MHHVGPPLFDELGKGGVEVVECPLVHIVQLAVGESRPDLIRLRLGEEAVALLALAPELGQLLLLQQLGLSPKLCILVVQLDEDGDLRAQDLGTERFEDIVDGARRIAPEDLFFVLGDRRDEDDRNVTRPLTLLDQRGGLEAVELRHLDVEQDDRDVVLQEGAEGVLAGVGVEEVLAERIEDSLQREQVLGPVVDEEDVRHYASLPRGTGAGALHRS